MNKCTLFILLIFSLAARAQNVGVGTNTPHASAKLDVTSTNSGLLPPRMTQTERNAIASPAAGLIIYNTTSNSIEFYNGSTWYNFSDAVSNAVFASTPINKLLGGAGSETLYSMQQTADGGYIMAGTSSSSNTGTLSGITNHGLTDAWIIKLNGSGKLQWQKLLGGSGYDVPKSIQQTKDGGYAIAGTSYSSNTGTLTGVTTNGSQDVWIIKLDGSGNLQWQKLFGGSQPDIGTSIRQTIDGGYIVSAETASSNSGTLTGLFPNGNGGDAWIFKLDATGNLQWQKLFGGSLENHANMIQQSSDGGYIIAGYTYSSNTGTLAGVTSNGLSDYWIMKIDGSGNIQWQKLLGGSDEDHAYSIRQTSDGGYIIAGSSASSNTGTLTGLNSNGLNDYWIVKLNTSGTLQWQKLLGGSEDDIANCIYETTDGGYIIAGNTYSSNTGTLTNVTSNGSFDYWIMKMDVSGGLQWQRLLGGSAADNAQFIQQTSDGAYIVGGTSSSANTGTLSGVASYGTGDVWILKIDQLGNPL